MAFMEDTEKSRLHAYISLISQLLHLLTLLGFLLLVISQTSQLFAANINSVFIRLSCASGRTSFTKLAIVNLWFYASTLQDDLHC